MPSTATQESKPLIHKTCPSCLGNGYECWCRDCQGGPAIDCVNRQAWTKANPGRTKTCGVCGGSGFITQKPVVGLLRRTDVEVLRAINARLTNILQMNHDIENATIDPRIAAGFVGELPARLDKLRLALGDLVDGFPVAVEKL